MKFNDPEELFLHLRYSRHEKNEKRYEHLTTDFYVDQSDDEPAFGHQSPPYSPPADSDNQPFVPEACNLCGFELLSKSAKYHHFYTWHQNAEIHQCEHCKVFFLRDYQLAYHLHKKHGKQVLKDCTRCGVKHEFFTIGANSVYEFKSCKGRMGRRPSVKPRPASKKRRADSKERVHPKWPRLARDDRKKIAKLAERCKSVDELVDLAKESSFEIPRGQLNYFFKKHAEEINETTKDQKQSYEKWKKLSNDEKYKVAKFAEGSDSLEELIKLVEESGLQIPREQLKYFFKHHAQTINHVEKIKAEEQKVHDIMQKVAEEFPNGATVMEALPIIHTYSPKTYASTARKWLRDHSLHKNS